MLLYLEGDRNAPKYVGGALRYAGVECEVVLGPIGELPTDVDVFLLSDYPAGRFSTQAMEALAQRVRDGAGLVMVGGWTSFGRGGYAGTPVGDALPVSLERGDDRENVASGAWLRPRGPHELVEGLPWDEPPVVTGWNRITPKSDARVIVDAVRLRREGEAPALGEAVPILIVGTHGRGWVAALATDLAPHWSGGWTDWGEPRVAAGEGEELGMGYVRFVERLCRWAARAQRPAGREEPWRLAP